MTFEHIHREEARHAGEPSEATPSELAGFAPPCQECGKRERVDDTLCEVCLDDA